MNMPYLKLYNLSILYLPKPFVGLTDEQIGRVLATGVSKIHNGLEAAWEEACERSDEELRSWVKSAKKDVSFFTNSQYKNRENLWKRVFGGGY